MIKPLQILIMFCMPIVLQACDRKEPVGEQELGSAGISSENEQIALDIATWAMPVVSFFAQKEANIRDMGAQPNQILFWSRPLDHHNKVLTPNDVTLYISAQIETFVGPMVLEVPGTDEIHTQQKPQLVQ